MKYTLSSPQWPGTRSTLEQVELYPRRRLLFAGCKQQVILELNLHARRPVGSGLDGAEIFSLRLVYNLVSAGSQTAEFDFTFPRRRGRGEEGVIHCAVFFDRVALRSVVSVVI
jgi:hypothetical protein